ncbi:tRNA1(Val) (adenine(37)-N6)-methyltransferase [Helicobacter sp. MIT 14-3879]|uniref:tRNA1(Val) (adenine(37)-N6)-methyltransferase n=1 Tax=Helicobacter sp. MIT 14-3879 TaxID=2040649 RepID=UPI000E1EF97F|nr:methyltransferase [Helicobacter sp. MIT 14-3879]RDU65613.1 SAM-dependent methyltransferase [Helicobacter sp. MIT 14-3879]
MGKKRLDIYQIENGYCYNSDSLFLYFFINKFLKNNISLLDIGAGSGILGLLCARDFSINLTLCDINNTNTKLCKKNADINNIACEILNQDILDSNLSNFDFIISNPPFYRKDNISSKNTHLFLAKKSENLPFNLLASFVRKSLKQNGKFIFCYDAKEIYNVFIALNKNKFNISTIQFIYPNESKNANLVMICCDFSKKQLEVLPPIFNFQNKSYSQKTKEIFSFCNTHSIKIKENLL